MAWKAIVTVATNTTVDDLARAGLEPDGTSRPARQAADAGLRPQLSAVAVGDDVVLLGHGAAEQDLAAVLAEALRTEIVSARFVGGELDYYTWTVHHGAGVRKWEFGEGEKLVDEGEPLEEELGVTRLEERTLLAMLQLRTGIAVGDWIGETAVNLRQVGGKPRRRGWFGRRSRQAR